MVLRQGKSAVCPDEGCLQCHDAIDLGYLLCFRRRGSEPAKLLFHRRSFVHFSNRNQHQRSNVYDFHNQIKIIFPFPTNFASLPDRCFYQKVTFENTDSAPEQLLFCPGKRVRATFLPSKKVTFDDLCRQTNETRILSMTLHFSHLIKNAPEIMEYGKPLQKFSSSKH